MLLGSYQLLFEDPSSFIRLAVLVALALVTAITVHEFSHALVATGLGDLSILGLLLGSRPVTTKSLLRG